MSDDSGSAPSAVSHWSAMARLLCSTHRWSAGAALALNALLGLLPVVFAAATSLALGQVPLFAGQAGAEGTTRLTLLLAVAVVSYALHQTLTPFQAAVGENVARNIDGRLAQELMTTALSEAPLATLEECEAQGMLDDARNGLGAVPPTPGQAVAGGLALVARYAQLMGAVILLALVLPVPVALTAGGMALAIRHGRRGASRRLGEMWHGLAGPRQRVTYLRATAASLTSAKDFRMLGISGWFQDRHTRDSEAYLTRLWKGRRRVMFGPYLGYTAIGLAGSLVVLIWTGHAAATGGLDVVGMALALQAILICARFGAYFPESDDQTEFGLQAYGALRRFRRRSRAEPRPTRPAEAARAVPRASHAPIMFDRVRFGYPGRETPVLNDLTLEIATGSSTAIVGLNGSGKTTLVKLLAGLYEPTAGRVTVGGLDLRSLPVREWHRQLAVVFQDFARYELSAGANIGLGAPELLDDQDELLAAAQRAGALELVRSLPAGLHTPLSRQYSGGTELSGGQWQRIALARALAAVRQGASVLVLDEPTAQLDVRAEAAFHDQFLDLAKGLTTVIISHRFSTVRKADHIVVLSGGRVVEQGTHAALVEAGGSYAELFRIQSERFHEHGTDAGPC